MSIVFSAATTAFLFLGCSRSKSNKEQIKDFFIKKGVKNTTRLNNLSKIAAKNGWDIRKLEIAMKTINKGADKLGCDVALNINTDENSIQIMDTELQSIIKSPLSAFKINIYVGCNVSTFNIKDIEAAAIHENRHVNHFYWVSRKMNINPFIYNRTFGTYSPNMQIFIGNYLEFLMQTVERDLGKDKIQKTGDISILSHSIGKYIFPHLSQPRATGEVISYLSNMLQETAVIAKSTEIELHSKSLVDFINKSIEKETIANISPEQIEDPKQAGKFFNTLIKTAMFNLLSDKLKLMAIDPKYKTLQKKIKGMKYKNINKIYDKVYNLFDIQYYFTIKYMPQ